MASIIAQKAITESMRIRYVSDFDHNSVIYSSLDEMNKREKKFPKFQVKWPKAWPIDELKVTVCVVTNIHGESDKPEFIVPFVLHCLPDKNGKMPTELATNGPFLVYQIKVQNGSQDSYDFELNNVNLKQTKNQVSGRTSGKVANREATNRLNETKGINYNEMFISGADLNEYPEYHYYGEIYKSEKMDPFDAGFGHLSGLNKGDKRTDCNSKTKSNQGASYNILIKCEFMNYGSIIDTKTLKQPIAHCEPGKAPAKKSGKVKRLQANKRAKKSKTSRTGRSSKQQNIVQLVNIVEDLQTLASPRVINDMDQNDATVWDLGKKISASRFNNKEVDQNQESIQNFTSRGDYQGLGNQSEHQHILGNVGSQHLDQQPVQSTCHSPENHYNDISQHLISENTPVLVSAPEDEFMNYSAISWDGFLRFNDLSLDLTSNLPTLRVESDGQTNFPQTEAMDSPTELEQPLSFECSLSLIYDILNEPVAESKEKTKTIPQDQTDTIPTENSEIIEPKLLYNALRNDDQPSDVSSTKPIDNTCEHLIETSDLDALCQSAASQQKEFYAFLEKDTMGFNLNGTFSQRLENQNLF